jgi:hypothetical protein
LIIAVQEFVPFLESTHRPKLNHQASADELTQEKGQIPQQLSFGRELTQETGQLPERQY